MREVDEREELQLFLDDPSVAVLCVHAAETGRLHLSNRLSISEEQKGQRHAMPTQFRRTADHKIRLYPGIWGVRKMCCPETPTDVRAVQV